MPIYGEDIEDSWVAAVEAFDAEYVTSFTDHIIAHYKSIGLKKGGIAVERKKRTVKKQGKRRCI